MRAERAVEPTKSENITGHLAAFGAVLGGRFRSCSVVAAWEALSHSQQALSASAFG